MVCNENNKKRRYNRERLIRTYKNRKNDIRTC